MEFLVRVQDVFELLAFVSNGLRLPRPPVARGNSAGDPAAALLYGSCEHLFYRNRRDAQSAGGFEVMSPGNAIILNGVTQDANPEIGVPGWPEGLTTTVQTSMLTIVSPLAH
jgi:hypothetical protein